MKLMGTLGFRTFRFLYRACGLNPCWPPRAAEMTFTRAEASATATEPPDLGSLYDIFRVLFKSKVRLLADRY